MKNFYTTILCFITLAAQAQDPIFTQYFRVPQTINPAFTAFTEKSSIGGLHRTQWPDAKLRINSDYLYGNAWIDDWQSGFGVSVLSQRESFADYSLTQINGSYVYRIQLNDDWYLRPALEFGAGTKSYGFNLTLGDQLNIATGTIDPVSIDPSIRGNNESRKYIDVGAGLLLNNVENYWLGISLRHLNKPNISFMERGEQPLDMFFSVSGGYQILMPSNIFPFDSHLLIRANYMQQGNFNRLDVGGALDFSTFLIGAFAATNPGRNTQNAPLVTSINPYLGLNYKYLKFGYSYDVMLNNMGRNGGIHELSLIYEFDWEHQCDGCPPGF